MRHVLRSATRPARFAPASTPSQCVFKMRGGTKLIDIGMYPRSPASTSVSEFADTPATQLHPCRALERPRHEQIRARNVLPLRREVLADPRLFVTETIQRRQLYH